MKVATTSLCIVLASWAPAAKADDVTLYSIADGICGQSVLSSSIAPYAIKYEDLTEGTCASVGYTESYGSETQKVPFMGDIEILKYVQPGGGDLEFKSRLLEAEANATATLYKIKDDVCGQSTLNAKFAPEAKKFAGLTDGTCAPLGYTVPNGTEVQKVPVIGEVDVAFFLKPSAAAQNKTATLYKIEDAVCGQSTLSAEFAPYAIKFAGLKDGKCALLGYTVPNGTKEEKFPAIGEVDIEFFLKA